MNDVYEVGETEVSERALLDGFTTDMRGYLAAAGDRLVRPSGELIAPRGILNQFRTRGLVGRLKDDKFARWGYSAPPTEQGRLLATVAFELCEKDGSWKPPDDDEDDHP